MKNIVAAIQDSDYQYFGIRAIDELLAVGDICADSRVWDNGDATDEILDGASATAISFDGYTDEHVEAAINAALVANKPYFAEHRYIIASDHMVYGEDANEVILRDATVIAIIS